jgi:hypothetical protein
MAYMFGGSATGTRAGIMKVFSSGSATPLTFTMGGWASGASAQNAVIAGVSANTQGNYQFMLTMRNYTYVYIFGEKMGDVAVSGVAGVECDEAVHGLTYALQYYNTYAISVSGTPIALQFGGYIANAFLIGGSFQYMNPQSRLARFQFNFKTITT